MTWMMSPSVSITFYGETLQEVVDVAIDNLCRLLTFPLSTSLGFVMYKSKWSQL
ncbi:hypothetical protein ElyMa_000517200, partial [Elysia marginata]